MSCRECDEALPIIGKAKKCYCKKDHAYIFEEYVCKDFKPRDGVKQKTLGAAGC